jgi:hypothetical protein
MKKIIFSEILGYALLSDKVNAQQTGNSNFENNVRSWNTNNIKGDYTIIDIKDW